ncbi:shikimate kinase [Nostocoides sp. F2B08]|uniref:shikimate kinase n=1 Tax=Nostocoides sp. F2B08 TaxID=2653936 RepID=UPI001262F20C|nr:shikimate kinase [Tetrasphaera sp. F2B08]KAB7744610.1 shikimate kinase [Tetrasphaera sp. F2B08]
MTSYTATSGPVAILIGPMGVGKSTVGRLLADLLEVPFLDVDDVIVEREQRPIADIFVDDGEPYFREVERVMTLRLLDDHPGVLALGGGAPMQDDIAASLAGRPVVFLDVGIADAARRIGFDTSRPLLAVNPRATWVAMMNARRETYERLGRWRVDTAGREATEVAREVAALIASAVER